MSLLLTQIKQQLFWKWLRISSDKSAIISSPKTPGSRTCVWINMCMHIINKVHLRCRVIQRALGIVYCIDGKFNDESSGHPTSQTRSLCLTHRKRGGEKKRKSQRERFPSIPQTEHSQLNKMSSKAWGYWNHTKGFCRAAPNWHSLVESMGKD